jgi:hypothetical protein
MAGTSDQFKENFRKKKEQNKSERNYRIYIVAFSQVLLEWRKLHRGDRSTNGRCPNLFFRSSLTDSIKALKTVT